VCLFAKKCVVRELLSCYLSQQDFFPFSCETIYVVPGLRKMASLRNNPVMFCVILLSGMWVAATTYHSQTRQGAVVAQGCADLKDPTKMFTCSSDADCGCNAFNCQGGFCTAVENTYCAITAKTAYGLGNVIVFAFYLYGAYGHPVALSKDAASSILEIWEAKPPGSPFQAMSRLESSFNIAPTTILTQIRVLLLLDTSGSVQPNIEDVKNAVNTLLQSLQKERAKANSRSSTFTVCMNIRAFAGNINYREVTAGFQQDIDVVLRNIETSSWSPVDGDPSTNLNGAYIDGMDLFDGRNADTEQQCQNSEVSVVSNFILLFTDGRDQANIKTQKEVIQKLGKVSNKVRTYGVTLKSDETFADLMKEYCQTGVFAIDSYVGIADAFQKVVTMEVAQASNFYVYQYCTPMRSGKAVVSMRFNTSAVQKSRVVDDTVTVDSASFDRNQPLCHKDNIQTTPSAKDVRLLIQLDNSNLAVRSTDLVRQKCELTAGATSLTASSYITSLASTVTAFVLVTIA
jgi:hypothetical protein